MDSILTLSTAATHQLYAMLLMIVPDRVDDDEPRDRGAVSLEQVLWFVAAGVAVAVIANVLWGKIKTEADKDITVPTKP
jgi:hypothetical protein